MKPAEEYIGNWKNVDTDGKTVRMILVEHAVVSINEARKEAIEESAKSAKAKPFVFSDEQKARRMQCPSIVHCAIDKQSILSLINELK